MSVDERDDRIERLKAELTRNILELGNAEKRCAELEEENMILSCENQMYRIEQKDLEWEIDKCRYKITPSQFHRKRVMQGLKRFQEGTGMEWKAVWGTMYKMLERLTFWSWREAPRNKKKIDIIWANPYLRDVFTIIVHVMETHQVALRRSIENKVIDDVTEEDAEMGEVVRNQLRRLPIRRY
jgi:hypothetical protein